MCTIFCMREAVTVSNSFRMRTGPLGPKSALKTKICFGALFGKKCYSFWEPLGPWVHGATVGAYFLIRIHKQIVTTFSSALGPNPCPATWGLGPGTHA